MSNICAELQEHPLPVADDSGLRIATRPLQRFGSD